MGEWLKTSPTSRISIFDREGRLTIALYKAEDGSVKTLSNLEAGDVYLSNSVLKKLSQFPQTNFRDLRPKYGLELITYTQVLNQKQQTVGYIEENIIVDKELLSSLKKRLNLELVIFDKDLRPALSTNEDFQLYPRNFFLEQASKGQESFFEISSRGSPFGFLLSRLTSESSEFYLGLATSKRDVKAVIRGINKALFTVVGVIVMLLIMILFSASNLILKPLFRLVQAAQKIEGGEFGTQIPIESDTEIGLLTTSFNKMSKRVAEAKEELERKIRELEDINHQLQETQAQLVHTSKMVGLGQLVAGVAHELNNPISFVYSNMSYLKDYSQKLQRVIETAEKSPSSLAAVKDEVEFDYIMKDLPKLISSCEEGARRVRDIVVGLRNFSRLDEVQIKDVDINEGILNTLDLLSGEFKNKIEIHKDLNRVPPLRCYPSQLNQVFMNLLTNASQAIESAGNIWVKVFDDESSIYVSIKDDGKGIPKKIYEKIFDPFFTTKPVGQGTGLGLSISYGIVKKHGGDIRVESEEGVGSTFTISLPKKGPLSEA